MMFTPEQMQYVKNACEGSLEIFMGEMQLAVQIKGEYGGNRRNNLNEVVRLISRATRDTNMIPLLLLGYREHDLDLPARLDLCWQRIDRAIADTIPTAIKQAKEVRNLEGLVLHLNNAHDRFTQLFRIPKETFLHSDPAPSIITGPRRTIIATHGDYFNFQRHMHDALHYWNDWVDTFVKIYPTKKGNNEHFGDAYGAYAFCAQKLIQVAALNAGISLYWKWDSFDQFSKTLKSLQVMWARRGGESATEIYNSFFTIWARALGLSEVEVESFGRSADSWRNMDNGGEETMEFPNSVRNELD